MSDLENLTSILSDLINTDGIETSTATELTDATNFNGSRLDFGNLANCITGSDASLHQCSDENVSSLLESHLTELTHTENASIVEAATEQLDDVTPFDLDKPIESLLESGSSEFISQECSHPQLPIVDKNDDLQSPSCLLNTISNDTINDLENGQSILNECNEKANEISKILDQSEVESNILPHQSNQNDFSDNPELNSLVEVEECKQIAENVESNVENECNQPEPDTVPNDEGLSNEEDHCETIIADQVVDETLLSEVCSKPEGKKRRRILVFNDGDSDDSELEEERERLLQTKSPTPVRQSTETNAKNQNDLLNDANIHVSVEEKAHPIDDEVDYIRDPFEKPGPKSKKQSTHLYNALKAKALLESAIVIPARKKKKRVIDSDDEFSESALNLPIASVDDIGLIPDDNNLMPLNVSIEIEQREIVFDTTPKIRVKNDLIAEPNDDSGRTKRESLSRTTTQAKMEKYHANNNRRHHKKKETRDIFGTPLNAPYVDSSSDEDYFLPQDSTKKQNHSQRYSNNRNTLNSSMHQRRRKGHIPDDIYFNAKVPLHVLYSYDDSSSDDEKNVRSTAHSTHSPKPSFQPTNRTLNKMPPVHKIVPKTTVRKAIVQKTVPKHSEKMPKQVTQPTVFEQLDKLKRLLKVSGIKVNVNELLKGSKTFQERCERIRNLLSQNGIEGEPTMAKCKKLKKQLKLKEEIAGLDPNAIINVNDDEGRPKRTTRRATRRNYVFDEPEETKKPLQTAMKEDASQLLQKMKDFIDSDSDYENHENSEHDQNTNNNTNSNSDIVDSTKTVETIIDSIESSALSETAAVQIQTLDESQSVLLQTDIENTSATIECTIQSLDQV